MSNQAIMIAAIIFDFDGLILDTEGCDFHVWREIYREHGFELTYERYQGSVGATNGRGSFDPYVDFEEQLGRPVDWDVLEPHRRARALELIAQQSLMPGVEEYLNMGKALGLKIGLASSSGHAWVEPHLNRLGVNAFFQTIQCMEDVKDTKPAPDLYLAALKALDVRPRSALAFEDSVYGLQAAKRAGMRCVVIPSRRSQKECFAEADMCLDSLANIELKDLLQKLNYG